MMQARERHTAGHKLRRYLPGAWVQTLLQGAAVFGASFLLAGMKILGRSVPVALAPVAAMAFGFPSVCAYLGACCGYLAFWGLSGAVEPAAAGFLILAETCIFAGLLPRDRRWFMPLSAAGMYLLVGFLHLLERRFPAGDTVFFMARLLMLAVACAQAQLALQKERAALLVMGFCVLSGCGSASLLGVPLGVIPASALAALTVGSESGIMVCAACGLAVDLSGAAGGRMTALFCFAALVMHHLSVRSRAVRAALLFLCAAAGTLASGADARSLAGVFLGVVLSLIVPNRVLRQLGQKEEQQSAETRFAGAAMVSDVLLRLGRTLGRARVQNIQTQSAAMFDRAAENVCRDCSRWSVCWEARASDTYLSLSRSAGRILRRGEARREDLPEAFLAQCTNLENFLAAVNGALEEQTCRRQYQCRLAESRLVLSSQLCAAARLLQRAMQPGAQDAPEPVFSAELGIYGCGADGAEVSGDCTNGFSCGEWYYALLCDGMGTGEDAARESKMAAGLLHDLICAGLEAQEALEMLNGVYILRGDGAFSTIDLAQVSLVSGEGYLMKWGAAPSYLRRAQRVMRLGSTTLPPGLGVHENAGAECIPINLRGGETLVLASDGTDSAQLERRLGSYDGRSPQELARILVGEGDSDADDRTAAVLRLRRASPRRVHRRGNDTVRTHSQAL